MKSKHPTTLLLIRSFLFALGQWTLTVLYGSVVPLIWLFAPKIRHKFFTSWTIIIISWLRMTCGVKYRVRGKGNLNELTGPYIVLSKHQSAWETLYFQHLFWPTSTILKKELLNIPFFGWGLRAMSPIGIDRSNPRDALRQVKTQGEQRLKEGFNLVIFPEGSRMPLGVKGNYARSGADIAKLAHVPIVPVAVNAGKCWPNKEFVKRPGLISVVIGKPILPDKQRNTRDTMRLVEDWIESTMSTLDD